MDKVGHQPRSRIPVPARSETQTVAADSTAATTAKPKIITKEQEVPLPELENLDSIRSQVEKSLDAFIRDRKKLQEILPVEGSSEQERCTTESSVDLKAELKRHRELTSKVGASLKANGISNTHSEGPVKKISSFEYLQSIMNEGFC